MLRISKLIKIKHLLAQKAWGKFLIKIYHFVIAVPIAKIYSLKFHFIKKNLKEIKFYSYEDTFNIIKTEKKSLCRFGDGEISWINMDSKGYFNQENSEELSNKLKEVVLSDNNNILIGIPDFFGSLDHYSKKRRESRNTHLAKYYKTWMEVLSTNKIYTDSLITRVYYGLNNNSSKFMFDSWKSIWNDKDVIIVEGEQTRFGVGNDLLYDAKSVRRIIAPAENAFSVYDQLLAKSKMHITDSSLFIISLGPTATVLAYDIGLGGSQAIDIGHLDIEYEWYLSGSEKKKPVIGKYVNEAGGAPNTELPERALKKYKSEIVETVL